MTNSTKRSASHSYERATGVSMRQRSTLHADSIVSSVVDQSYQAALNLVFANKKAQDDYQEHPLHLEFVEKAFKPNCVKVVVYDFE